MSGVHVRQARRLMQLSRSGIAIRRSRHSAENIGKIRTNYRSTILP